MGKIVSSVTDAIGLTDSDAGDRAAQSSVEAAEIAAQGQREALDYIKEVERLPQQYRGEALTQLAGIFGLPGGQGSQQQFIDQAMQSPIYQQMVGNRAQGEEAILRNASATGGLRSGNTNANLYDYNTRLENEALTTAYGQQLQGLTGMANLQTNPGQVANMIAAPGNTTAQGIVAGAQAQQQQTQANMSSLSGLYGAGMKAYAMSDIRLKSNIKHEGVKNGHHWFSWDWNEKAEELGLSGRSEGVMAHFVYETDPDAVKEIGGLLAVDYGKLFKEKAVA